MSNHTATISWKRKDAGFIEGKYSREHTWTFDGGMVLPASPSPSEVRAPYSNPASVDPEEAFVAAISSCHMLSFLYVASRKGFQVDAYQDEAIGVMTKNEKGVRWVSAVTLHPKVTYSGGKIPGPADVEHLHHLAHEECFIANSVKTHVTVE
jgi:organic hydroperoxide reductase OsmC/OhrA